MAFGLQLCLGVVYTEWIPCNQERCSREVIDMMGLDCSLCIQIYIPLFLVIRQSASRFSRLEQITIIISQTPEHDITLPPIFQGCIYNLLHQP